MLKADVEQELIVFRVKSINNRNMLFFGNLQADFANAKLVLNMNHIRLEINREFLTHIADRYCHAILVKLFKHEPRYVNNSINELCFILLFGSNCHY